MTYPWCLLDRQVWNGAQLNCLCLGVMSVSHWPVAYRWLSARLRYLQCISAGDVLMHWRYCSFALGRRYNVLRMVLLISRFVCVCLFTNCQIRGYPLHLLLFKVRGCDWWLGTPGNCNKFENNQLIFPLDILISLLKSLAVTGMSRSL